MKNKVCTSCVVSKCRDEFYERGDKPHLIQSHCKECIKKKRKRHRLENIERFKLKDIKYHSKNREKRLLYLKDWQSKNKHIRRIKDKAKRDTNVHFAMRSRIHNRLRMALKRNTKHSTVIEYLGCDLNYFVEYFKSKFTNGMNWDRFLSGEIHIDHIIPCSHFDLSIIDDQMKCFNYTNLQPMWACDNLSKSNKISGGCHR